ncbi:MAG: NEW3 domain-containing protein, partial [Spirochaetota bacterium]|nr:NEW3 domain-containing protein [Spirochaetota bacterium]
RARGSEASYQLPLTIRSGGNLPQRLALDAELPSVRGTPDSDFTYEVEVRNNSTREVLVNLDAQAPRGFQTVFKERYGNKELSTVPIEAGENKTVKVEVSPPQGVSEGVYEVRVIARTEAAEASTLLNMDIKGQPELELYGPNGRLSGSAVAGREQAFTLTVENTGSASARNLELSSSSPRNWSVEFETESIDELPAGESREVKAVVTPSSEAVAGDYNVTFRVRSDLGSISEKFRITVRTSTLWGIVAVLIIAAAAVVLVMSVRRFGRR